MSFHIDNLVSAVTTSKSFFICIAGLGPFYNIKISLVHCLCSCSSEDLMILKNIYKKGEKNYKKKIKKIIYTYIYIYTSRKEVIRKKKYKNDKNKKNFYY
jgi:hypothetical protein